MIRYCIDCLHYRADEVKPDRRDLARCEAPLNTKPSAVDGKPSFILKYCENVRRLESLCGENGKWFEDRETALGPREDYSERETFDLDGTIHGSGEA